MTSRKLPSLLALFLLIAAQPVAEAMPGVATATPASDVFAFKIGALNAFALKDGDIELPNDGKTYGVGQSPGRVAEILAAAGLPSDRITISIEPLLVADGNRLLLFDTGAGDANFARAGRLPRSLRAAGFKPSQVTDIFISHKHPDHIGGLLDRKGGLAFPNASIHMLAPEWAAMKADSHTARLVAAVAPKVVAFAPGAVILPGRVNGVALPGHTPGHSAYEIISGEQRLLFIGDAAHHSIISVRKPDWRIQFDEQDAVARPARRALLQNAADRNLRLYAGHFPFPGLGHIRAADDGFIWIPEPIRPRRGAH